MWTPGLTLDEIERLVVFEALAYYDGNRTHTAQSLGMSRRTLRNWMRKWRAQGYAITMPRCARLAANRASPMDSSIRGPKLPDFGSKLAENDVFAVKKDRAEVFPPQPQCGNLGEKITWFLSDSEEVPYQAKWQAAQSLCTQPSELSQPSEQCSEASRSESDET